MAWVVTVKKVHGPYSPTFFPRTEINKTDATRVAVEAMNSDPWICPNCGFEHPNNKAALIEVKEGKVVRCLCKVCVSASDVPVHSEQK